MTPYSWKKAQRVGVAFQQQELFYAENATLEHLLEVASAAPHCTQLYAAYPCAIYRKA